MNKTKIALLITGGCFFSANLFASSVDFRHEYKHETKQQASRIKMGTSFENNFAVSLELKFKSADNTDFMKDLVNNGSELGLGYKWKINDEWALQPGMPIEFGQSSTTYKPQLRLIYKPAMIDGFSVSGRYRLDIKPTQTKPSVNNKYRDRYTVNFGYNIQNVVLGLELNYYKAHSDTYVLYDNKNTNYENNFTAGYKMGSWKPWIELGDVSVSSKSADRELRSRVGLSYSF
ncbi:N-acetylneuraminic acid outer membrane channel protein NanC [Psychromonas sp. RZ22]|uniref:oligogalacturonate-specific porin KdgM family protein n=1 Tax=Psychromonas algarum TaxID=2555643 RepID=UPI0010674114|nr:oligogalacturonate-specific porin KdgM family protein [Psychromonas sp. RZ22]TEW53134.1 N-acetylneuraminic acid outer membrane channel protein NanC [Psychromonas sp. RZ22]